MGSEILDQEAMEVDGEYVWPSEVFQVLRWKWKRR